MHAHFIRVNIDEITLKKIFGAFYLKTLRIFSEFVTVVPLSELAVMCEVSHSVGQIFNV